MKNVKNFVAAMVIFIIGNIYRTVKSLKANSSIVDEKNTTPMLDGKDESLRAKVFAGWKKIRLANDRYGRKQYGLIAYFESAVFGQDKNGNGVMVILATVNPNQTINAVLLAPTDKDGRVALGNSIRTKGAITTWITIPPLQLAALIPLIAAVQDAGTKAEMNSAWFALNKALRKIMQLVQTCMDENISESANICALYGFHVGGKGGKHIQIFEGFTGTVTGTADMLADVGPDGCAYVWWSWNAARTVATYLMTTTYAHATIKGQVSNVPLNVSCNWVEGETVTHESQIITVVPK